MQLSPTHLHAGGCKSLACGEHRSAQSKVEQLTFGELQLCSAVDPTHHQTIVGIGGLTAEAVELGGVAV